MVNKDLAICEYKDINNNSSKVIPISNLNWENISKFYGIVSENNEIKKDNLPSNFADFVSTSYIKDKHCPNIFKLDKNYANYSGFATRMSVDNEPFDYVEDLKLTFDAKSYLEEFFYDDGKIFNYKLSYENSELIHSMKVTEKGFQAPAPCCCFYTDKCSSNRHHRCFGIWEFC